MNAFDDIVIEVSLGTDLGGFLLKADFYFRAIAIDDF